MAGRILVVHRNELVLDVIQEMLQELGYTVIPVVDGRRALAKAIADHFQLLIVDRNLTEDIDGVWLVERLRRYGIRTPVIGTATDGEWEEGDESVAQVDRFLPAPFDSGELIAAVKSLLERNPFSETIEDLIAPPDLDLQTEVPELPVSPEFKALTEPVDPRPLPGMEKDRPEIQRDRQQRAPVQPPVKEWKPPAASHRPPRVLVVHSHEAMRKQVGRWLSDAGYDVAEAASGSDAYENALMTDYEMIVTDLWLTAPEGREMDGFEMIESLRMSGVDCPLAVVTGYITKKMVHELLEWRVGKILLNPSDPGQLLDFARTRVPAS